MRSSKHEVLVGGEVDPLFLFNMLLLQQPIKLGADIDLLLGVMKPSFRKMIAVLLKRLLLRNNEQYSKCYYCCLLKGNSLRPEWLDIFFKNSNHIYDSKISRPVAARSIVQRWFQFASCRLLHSNSNGIGEKITSETIKSNTIELKWKIKSDSAGEFRSTINEEE